MRILLWIGNEPNQKALANKINSEYPLIGIIAETKKSNVVLNMRDIPEKIFERIYLRSVATSWFGMLKYYSSNYPDYPDVSFLNVTDINSEESFVFSEELRPDLIIVSGTRLIKDKLLNLKPTIGVLNLHTGLSPYIKGGPNCTNWCIALRKFHLIGNTIMWIDRGIDSGNIITSDFVRFTGRENLNEVHIKVMEQAHSLYLKAIKYIEKGGFNSIPQSDISKGKTYYSKDWNFRMKIDLVNNFRHFREAFESGNVDSARLSIRVIQV